jgi:trehalose 6-phosphate phosphatase
MTPSLQPPALQREDALFLDFDGSLVEIAPTPDSVRVDPGLAPLLEGAAGRLGGALAVVSGRRLEDLTSRLDPFHGAAAGTHGLERRSAGGLVLRSRADGMIDRARPFLAAFAAETAGVLLEDKGLAFSLHYRRNPEQAAACLKAAREAAQLSNYHLSVIEGKMVVELRPPAANKGRAILEFLGEPPFQGRRPVFLGDDRTDEDGFAVVNRLGGISIRVGALADSMALFDLADVPAVRAWLSEFVGRAPGVMQAAEAS